MSVVVVYSREGCHLCEDLLDDLAVLGRQHGFAIEVRDVDADPALRSRYHTRVPVVECEDEFVCEYFLDPEALLARLDQAR
jgi:hypothetical protein